MPVASVRRRGMGSPERGGGERGRHRLPTCATGGPVLLNAHRLKTCATGNLCYVGRQRYMRKLKVCQRRRMSHWPTVRLPTWIRAVPRIPGVNTLSASSSVISAS